MNEYFLADNITKCIILELKKQNKTKKISHICEIRENYIERLAYDKDKRLTLEAFLRLLSNFRVNNTYEMLGEISKCIIIPLPNTKDNSQNIILKKATEVMKEAIATFEIIQESLEDNNFTDEEKERACIEINNTVQVLAELKTIIYSNGDKTV